MNNIKKTIKALFIVLTMFVATSGLADQLWTVYFGLDLTGNPPNVTVNAYEQQVTSQGTNLTFLLNEAFATPLTNNILCVSNVTPGLHTWVFRSLHNGATSPPSVPFTYVLPQVPTPPPPPPPMPLVPVVVSFAYSNTVFISTTNFVRTP